MCLIAWHWSPQADSPLLWAANRDEFSHRATAHLQRWQHGESTVYSGLDLALDAHNGLLGTWSGFTASGRFAWLTNIRSPADKNPQAPSRGHLVSQYLVNEQIDPAAYLNALKAKAHRYNGFNLVVGRINADPARSECWHFNARSNLAQRLKPGVYGLSNANLDSPWPKTQALVQALTLASAQANSREARMKLLFQALQNTARYPSKQLPSTGLPIELEHALSAAFVSTKLGESAYGTRSCTVGSVANQRVDIQERSFSDAGVQCFEHRETFHLDF